MTMRTFVQNDQVVRSDLSRIPDRINGLADLAYDLWWEAGIRRPAFSSNK